MDTLRRMAQPLRIELVGECHIGSPRGYLTSCYTESVIVGFRHKGI